MVQHRTDMPVCNLNTARDPTISKIYALTNNAQHSDNNHRHWRVTMDKLPKRMRKRCNWHYKSTSVEINVSRVVGSWSTSISAWLWMYETPRIRVDAYVGNSERLLVRRVACALAASCYWRTLAAVDRVSLVVIRLGVHVTTIISYFKFTLRYEFDSSSLYVVRCTSAAVMIMAINWGYAKLFLANFPLCIVIVQILTVLFDEDFLYFIRFQPCETNFRYIFKLYFCCGDDYFNTLGRKESVIVLRKPPPLYFQFKSVWWLVMALSVAVFGGQPARLALLATIRPGRIRTNGCHIVCLAVPVTYFIYLSVAVLKFVYAPLHTFLSYILCSNVIFFQFLQAL